MIASLILGQSLSGTFDAFGSAGLLLADMPRGPGFYFSLVKIGLVLAVYLAWVRTCAWVDEDVRDLELPDVIWNPVMLGAGLLGLLLVWAFPAFWIAFALLLILFAAAALSYVTVRNQQVADDDKVLTERHLRELVQRYLRLRLPEGDDESSGGPPIRFVGKSTGAHAEDPSRVARAEGSKGYRAAR
jgi:hypothetical protein